ncbi:acyltransferase [Flavobacterium sp. 316]|uniref:1-acyl-sn-glycerol-3-phosphate acyltransferase n=1 Tax=Flavobacterium sediminilitoris TaxID=2024526 RepID=A0ABY4HKB0_9FLAO|nr:MULTISPECIES: 1-acyl-sn-glycerol-3-phosphate acyltransferase [Flavobacterium]KIX22814.1 acyltransferase [Flavobacterium sp. 316]UOX33281.1 1-acyl-sn-glycerol-3-phosphate acyltransferase [Flavobacterium sediminilitoris]
MKQKIYRFIFCTLFGWKVVGDIDREIKKCILIAVPHTSWWDFFLGIFSRGILNIEINFLAKKELFIFPFSYFFKWVGGAPLNRGKKENKVDAIAKIFKEKELFRLALAPEGTRKKVTQWKTGFYYMALKANIPIIPVAFDYGKKEVVYNEPFYPTGNIDEDLKKLQAYYKGVIGKIPEYSFTP